MQTDILEDVAVLGLYGPAQLIGLDTMLSLLAPRRSQEIGWSRCYGDDPPFYGYDFTTGQVYDTPPVCVKKRSKTVSGVIVGVPGHEIRWLQKIRFSRITSCDAE